MQNKHNLHFKIETGSGQPYQRVRHAESRPKVQEGNLFANESYLTPNRRLSARGSLMERLKEK